MLGGQTVWCEKFVTEIDRGRGISQGISGFSCRMGSFYIDAAVVICATMGNTRKHTQLLTGCTISSAKRLFSSHDRYY